MLICNHLFELFVLFARNSDNIIVYLKREAFMNIFDIDISSSGFLTNQSPGRYLCQL